MHFFTIPYNLVYIFTFLITFEWAALRPRSEKESQEAETHSHIQSHTYTYTHTH